MQIRTILAAAAATSIVALATVASASAHVSVSTNNPTAGGYGLLTVSVPHGCDGAATNKLEIKVPEGVTSYVPQRSPFWTAEVNSATLDEPIEGGHGEKITEQVDTVVYTAKTPLPDGELDLLPASIKFPDSEGDVYFPIVQTCVGGASNSWIEIPEEGSDEEPESPAGVITLAAASGDAHGGSDDSEEHEDAKAASSMDDEDHDQLVDDVDSTRLLAIIGIVVGALGLLFGLVAARRRK